MRNASPTRGSVAGSCCRKTRAEKSDAHGSDHVPAVDRECGSEGKFGGQCEFARYVGPAAAQTLS